MSESHDARNGALFAIGAYAFWGFIVLYYPLLRDVNAFEMLLHRVLWTTLTLGFILYAVGLLPELRAVLGHPRNRTLLVISAFLIGINWVTFMWAVTHDRIIHTSMGYFINPLLSVALGVVLLRERLRPLQVVSVGLAAAGVALLIYRQGSLPWVALVLPFTFGLYGLARKHVTSNTFVSLFVETLVLSPFALAYGLYLGAQDSLSFFNDGTRTLLALLFLGPITIVPLALFGAAAKRITLTALGFFQYLAPSLQFLLGLFVFNEAFSRAEFETCLFIWAGLAVFSADGYRTNRAVRRTIAEA